MLGIYFAESASQLVVSNPFAFKNGAVHGPCLAYRKQTSDSKGYYRSAMSVWQKRVGHQVRFPQP